VALRATLFLVHILLESKTKEVDELPVFPNTTSRESYYI